MSLAGVAHPVERHLAKVEVASSSLVTRSKKKDRCLCIGLFFLEGRGSNHLKARVRWTLAWRVGSRQHLTICPKDKLATSLVTRSAAVSSSIILTAISAIRFFFGWRFSHIYLPGPAVSAPSPTSPSSLAKSWRILYFRILPAAFMGKLSTKRMYRGTLCRAILALM